ncbi:MAG: hypothetical protein AB4372_36510 [Xenococcus sp. (in: cyanobacteria)]
MIPISQTKRRSSEISQGISIFVIGGGIGWLAGLSASPVIATVLASLVGIGAGIVTGLSSIVTGKKRETNEVSNFREIDARPAALLVLGIALAAPLGIMARTSQIFALDTNSTGGLAIKDIQEPKLKAAVLFAIRLEECELLLDQASSPNEQAFRDVLANTGTWGKELESNISDTTTLKRIIRSLCASD